MTSINITNITDGSPTGTGSFDVLMRSFKAHLDVEYKGDRLKGTDYANVLLGGMQTAMAQAMQFELSKAQASASVDLLLQQTLLATINAEVATATKATQIDKVTQGLEVITQTALKTIQEVGVLTQKVVTETAQTVGTVETVGGVLGTQMSLYEKQKAGYDRDAEHKAAKLYADFYSINQSVIGDIEPSAFGANGANCITMFDAMRAGVGAPATIINSLIIDDVTTDNIIPDANLDTDIINVTGLVAGYFSTTDVVTLTINETVYVTSPTEAGNFSIPVVTGKFRLDANKQLDVKFEATPSNGDPAIVVIETKAFTIEVV